MTADEFRILALSLSETLESAHMDHPDYRVGARSSPLFSPNDDWGMLHLTPDEQAMYIRIERGEPFNGAWGSHKSNPGGRRRVDRSRRLDRGMAQHRPEAARSEG